MVKKGLNFSITDSPPLSVIQQLVLEQGSFRKPFNHWKEIMDYSKRYLVEHALHKMFDELI
jgi:hypothetical protein